MILVLLYVIFFLLLSNFLCLFSFYLFFRPVQIHPLTCSSVFDHFPVIVCSLIHFLFLLFSLSLISSFFLLNPLFLPPYLRSMPSTTFHLLYYQFINHTGPSHCPLGRFIIRARIYTISMLCGYSFPLHLSSGCFCCERWWRVCGSKSMTKQSEEINTTVFDLCVFAQDLKRLINPSDWYDDQKVNWQQIR